MDLFEREQRVHDNAIKHLNELQNGASCDCAEFGILAIEYGRLLSQVRMCTSIFDKTANYLDKIKLDLFDKLYYDPLTGIYNRRFMEENFRRIIRSLARSGDAALSVLMLDVDFFKEYNDTYGHIMGDECLKSVAKAMASNISGTGGFVARYGGEEFIAVLPNTYKDGACAIAEIMLESVRVCNIPHERNEAADCVTVSIGITTGEAVYAQSPCDYIRRADEALYISKRNGRNMSTFINFDIPHK